MIFGAVGSGGLVASFRSRHSCKSKTAGLSSSRLGETPWCPANSEGDDASFETASKKNYFFFAFFFFFFIAMVVSFG
jgi:hypothetical protein